MNLTYEEKINKVKDLRPIDDVMFEVLANSTSVCEEILRTIMQDPKLVVTRKPIVQSSEKNLYGRSVRLDALCILGDESRCNIEVQRSNNDNHLRRARFNSASITTRDSNPGDTFDEVINIYIIYITESDFFKGGKTIYHVEKVIKETGQYIDDGEHEIFVNTAIDDGSDISELMTCFMQKNPKNPKFPNLVSEMEKLKLSKGGVSSVCEVMQYYEKLAAEEAKQRTIVENIKSLMFSLTTSADKAMDFLMIPMEDRAKYLKLLNQPN